MTGESKVAPRIFPKKKKLLLTPCALRGTDGSFQPVPSMTIVLFIVTVLPCQVAL